jgi:uncharacterized damage-inducible protein DinB
MTTNVLERMYQHLDWANRRLMALVDRDPERTRPVMHLLSHLIAAERVWLLRLRNEDSSIQPVWPTLTRETMGALVAENHAGYARLLSTFSDQELASEVVYTNQSGREFHTRVDDILIHVATQCISSRTDCRGGARGRRRAGHYRLHRLRARVGSDLTSARGFPLPSAHWSGAHLVSAGQTI